MDDGNVVVTSNPDGRKDTAFIGSGVDIYPAVFKPYGFNGRMPVNDGIIERLRGIGGRTGPEKCCIILIGQSDACINAGMDETVTGH